jgi:hypothetical protein
MGAVVWGLEPSFLSFARSNDKGGDRDKGWNQRCAKELCMFGVDARQ